MTITAVKAYTNSVAAEAAQYAWGIYVDKDIASAGSYLPPFSLGFTSTWMVHKSGIVVSSLYSRLQPATASESQAFAPPGDLQYRRYELNLRKYKRKLDSFNDTLVLSVENWTDSQIDIACYFYFRMLLLE